MRKTWINVNRHRIAANAKNGSRDPVVRFSDGKFGQAKYCSELAILDKNGEEVARIIYDPINPVLPCGARLAISAEHGVRALA